MQNIFALLTFFLLEQKPNLPSDSQTRVRNVCSASLLQCVHTGNVCASALSALPPHTEHVSDNNKYRNIIFLCPRAGCKRSDRRVQTERKRYSDSSREFYALWHVLKEHTLSLQTLDVAAGTY